MKSTDPERIARFTESLERCLADAEFLDRFYELFLASSPEIAAKFDGTDFKRQKRALSSSLYLMVMAMEGGDAANEYITRVAQYHSRDRLGVRPEMYDDWLDCLIRAAWDFDPEFDDDLESDWRAVMEVGIETMRAHY